MFQKIDIWNAAVQRLGDPTVILSEYDTSKPANLCRTYWPFVLSETASRHPFSAFIRQQPLALSTNPGIDGYQYCYALPGDYLSAIYLISAPATIPEPGQPLPFIEPINNTPTPGAPFAVYGGFLYSNAVTPSLLYTSSTVNISGLDGTLLNVIILLLASKIAFAITQNPGLSREIMSEIETIAMPNAIKNDFNEMAWDRPPRFGWITGCPDAYDLFQF